MKSFLVLIMCIFLSSCASKWDVELMNSYNGAIIALEAEKTKRIVAQTQAISSLGQSVGDPGYKAMLGRNVEEIDVSTAKVIKPRLNTDNGETAIHTAGGAVPFVSMMKVSTTSMENQKGDTVMVSDQGAVSLENSMNREENHATAFRDSTANLDKSGDTQIEEVVEPVEQVFIEPAMD